MFMWGSSWQLSTGTNPILLGFASFSLFCHQNGGFFLGYFGLPGCNIHKEFHIIGYYNPYRLGTSLYISQPRLFSLFWWNQVAPTRFKIEASPQGFKHDFFWGDVLAPFFDWWLPKKKHLVRPPILTRILRLHFLSTFLSVRKGTFEKDTGNLA